MSRVFTALERRAVSSSPASLSPSVSSSPATPSPSVKDFYKLDIRVGEIKKVWAHPDSTKLFCEEVPRLVFHINHIVQLTFHINPIFIFAD